MSMKSEMSLMYGRWLMNIPTGISPCCILPHSPAIRKAVKMIMGHDGYMELGNNLTIYADRESTKYKDKIEKKQINPSLPIFTYIPGRNNIDAVATPTEQYFAGRGLTIYLSRR